MIRARAEVSGLLPRYQREEVRNPTQLRWTGVSRKTDERLLVTENRRNSDEAAGDFLSDVRLKKRKDDTYVDLCADILLSTLTKQLRTSEK